MPREYFTESTTQIAQRVSDQEGSSCTPDSVRAAADAGLLPYIRLRNGTRLFQPSAADRLCTLRAKRRARRGKYPRALRVEVPA